MKMNLQIQHKIETDQTYRDAILQMSPGRIISLHCDGLKVVKEIYAYCRLIDYRKNRKE